MGEAEVLERHLSTERRHPAPARRRPPRRPRRVTAWDVERVVEYTLGGLGRVRFHLEAVRSTDSHGDSGS
ncbi:hypothetical protein ACFSNO_22510 [Streptomyces cirratus]